MIRFSEIIEKMDLTKGVNKAEGVKIRDTGISAKDKEGKKATAKEARGYYQKLLTLANQVQSWVEENDPIDISVMTPLIGSIIENDLIGPLYYYLVFEADQEDGLAAYSVGVTVFSLKIGAGMSYNNKELRSLAMIAFLHDVGMYRIPQGILNKEGELSEEEFEAIQGHPEISAEILSRLGDNHQWLADVALQVHERADGSGYPRGLREEEIQDFAYIIGLADMYLDMISERPYRVRIEKNQAVRDIIASSKGKFPARILKAFLNQVSFFPASSYVKLNDRTVARVITTNPDFPLKPTVEILYDGLGDRLKEARIVDLSKQPLLYITESIDEKDII